MTSAFVARAKWLLLLVWILPAAISVLGVYLVPPLFNQNMSMGEAFVAYLLAWLTWAAWVPVIRWFSNRVPLGNERWITAVVAHVALSLVVGAIQVFCFMFVLRAFRLFDPSWHYDSLFAVGMRYFAGSMVVVYWAILCAHTAIRLHSAVRVQAEAAARLEADLVNAQMHALRSQLNPHFLFNALNSVVTLIARDAPGAQRMIVRLSELLRATLAIGERSEVPLRHELELVERYLDVERVRFGDRLQTAIDAGSGLQSATVPALVLQPLVENAITHGVSQIAGVGCVKVRATAINGKLQLEVRDNGPGPMAQPRRPGAGIGIANLRARLERLYGDEQSVTIEAANGGGCVVTVTMPLRLGSEGRDG